MEKIKVSVVSPMNNEELCVKEFVNRVAKVMENSGHTYEIIIVDDGSTDKTSEILSDLVKNIKNMHVITLSRNCGQWAAIDAGITNSKGDYVVIMDSDLQQLPEEIPLFFEYMDKNYDLVSGRRKNRAESFYKRRLPSMIANFLLRYATGCPVKDMGGFNFIRGTIARGLNLKAGQHRLLPALVYIQGGLVAEIDISSPSRFAGKSHYGLGRIFEVLFDIFMLRFQSMQSSRPLYLFGRLSFWVLILGALFFIINNFVYGNIIDSKISLIILLFVVFFVFGFMSIGIVLEVITNAISVTNNNKSYIIQSHLKSRDLE